MIPKCVVPIGYVGVVVSFYGRKGEDTSGTAFRHGERVKEGEKGVWDTALGPGKYAFNTAAGVIVLVPTTNSSSTGSPGGAKRTSSTKASRASS